jgi:hypothetical protein
LENFDSSFLLTDRASYAVRPKIRHRSKFSPFIGVEDPLEAFQEALTILYHYKCKKLTINTITFDPD